MRRAKGHRKGGPRNDQTPMYPHRCRADSLNSIICRTAGLRSATDPLHIYPNFSGPGPWQETMGKARERVCRNVAFWAGKHVQYSEAGSSQWFKRNDPSESRGTQFLRFRGRFGGEATGAMVVERQRTLEVYGRHEGRQRTTQNRLINETVDLELTDALNAEQVLARAAGLHI
jgi:hypothetical protein